MEFDLVNMQEESDMMDSLNTENVKAEDMDSFMNKIIGVYKEQFPDWQKEYDENYDKLDNNEQPQEEDDNTPQEVKNLVQFLKNHPNLNLK